MARIKQLSKHLINQIAAGEVIERPASVVKELVENSIDAGSTKISIEINNECRNIRVADNGSGIHPDDIMLAFSKHATSKIASDEDLFEIHTMGFRGEALASIISISKLTCTTRTAEFEYGTKVKCENSDVQYSKTGCAIGTIMEVNDLFYNLPARLKFLKSSSTEFSYIQELVQSLALAHPECSFELKKNGKTMLKTSGQNNLLQTVKEIFPPETAKNLKEILKTDKISGLKMSGYVSTPNFTRSSKKSYYMYINSRSVKDAVFQKAVDTAYKSLIASGKYPFIILNLELPPSDIDVNVHPTKKEVRYKNPNQIFNFILTSVHGGLSNYTEQQTTKEVEEIPPQFLPQNDNVINFSHKKLESTGEVFFDKKDDTVYVTDKEMKKIKDVTVQNKIFTSETKPEQPEDNIIGQYKNTYILIEKDEGLEIVDQHIAEERYFYEKLMKEKEIVSQMLFVSDVIPVSQTDAEIIKENLAKFEKFGYAIEFLKENEIIFRKVPQMLAKVNPQEILADILENIDGNLDRLEEKILITTSCKASVKAGQKLSIWQMQEIIKKWRSTEMPYTCPHGRPISKIIPHKEIAGFFMRNT